MEPPLFFAPPEALDNDKILLSREESHHAKSVLRLKESSPVIVIDGKGIAYFGIISDLGKQKGAMVSVHRTVRNFGEPFVKLTLAAGLSEGSKFDLVVQKGTELGVSKFVPLETEKSKVKIENPSKASSRVKRLERVALSAVKQCRRSLCPQIEPITRFSDFLGKTDKNSLNLIFHPGTLTNKLNLSNQKPEFKAANLLVGPESGFSEAEIKAATDAGYQTVSLGPRVLRTETAAPVACALTMYWLGELS